MIVLIQCAAKKRAEAGHLQTADGRNVLFVAEVAVHAPNRRIGSFSDG
jgi:hypothetical protein